MEIVDNILQDKYQKKRLIIVATFVAVLLIILIFIYSLSKSPATCLDGKKNQNEQGVDCGGICSVKCSNISADDLVVQEKGIVASGAVNKYDLYSYISNPNDLYGSSNFQYQFTIKDADGQVIATRLGSNFILPSENKYIVENNIEIDKAPASVEFNVTNPKWVEFNQNYYEKPQLNIVNKIYTPITSGVGFGSATGLLKNGSPFDFNLIKLNVMLKDINGKIIALNSTEMRTIKSGENRDFRVLWLNRFSGDVMNIEIQAEANIFDSEAFTNKYFQSDQLQGSSYR